MVTYNAWFLLKQPVIVTTTPSLHVRTPPAIGPVCVIIWLIVLAGTEHSGGRFVQHLVTMAYDIVIMLILIASAVADLPHSHVVFVKARADDFHRCSPCIILHFNGKFHYR